MRVLVCGGRGYKDSAFLDKTLFEIHHATPIKCIIEGGALGADRLARQWAQCLMIPFVTFDADWSKGKGAGPIRNARMLKEGRPDMVIAFEGGKGTADMIHKAYDAGVRVFEPRNV